MTRLAKRTVPAFGTSATVAVTDPTALDDATALLELEVGDMDLAASRFNPESEIRKLACTDGRAIPVSELLFEALTVALYAARWSDGAVDPTLGRLMERLGYDRDFDEISGSPLEPPLRGVPESALFHPGGFSASSPGLTGLARVATPRRASPGWESIELDPARRTVTVAPRTLIDLGATAKALSADRAAAQISDFTGCGTLVSIGGDVAVSGEPPDGGWAIGVAQSSAAPESETDQVVAITSGGIASSSTTVRRWRLGGSFVHHIVDPSTGTSANSCWTLVSVAASSCALANAASTASIIWGPSASSRLALAGLPARLVSVTNEVTTICGWPDSELGPIAPERVAS